MPEISMQRLADIAWNEEMLNHGWGDRLWEDFAVLYEATVHSVTPENPLFVLGGGATAVITGDVCEGSTVIVAGGACKVTVYGNVEAGARILASGGAAEITILGRVDPSAIVISRGGGSTTTIMGY